MVTRSLLIALLGLALLPVSASAKGVTSAQVCGADECISVDDDALGPALLDSGGGANPPANGAAWYRVRLGIGENGKTFDTLPWQHVIVFKKKATKK